MATKIKKHILVIIVLIAGLILAIKNYSPGTFLSGWDSLHPEFNFGLAFSREISGVFRTEQGLGAVASHSHMADLPHLIILRLFSFIFSISFLRYFYVFSNLILGPLGIYFFLNKYIVKSKIGSLLGSLFYLLNLGTLQIFVVPFEMFTTQYAFLPWFFLFATDYIYEKKKPIKKLLLFSLFVILIMPSAYAATLWYLFFLIFVIYLAFLNLFDRSLPILKRSIILIVLTMAINSFWIMPNIYYVLNHGQRVPEALINKLFSGEAFLYNKEFGNIKDIALIKNFLFDWNVYTKDNNFEQLLSPWIAHQKQIQIQIIGFLFAILALVGIIKSLFEKNKILLSLFPALFICFFFLINENFPNSLIYNFFQERIPLFKEALRFPGDKILGIYVFIFTIYFAKSHEFVLEKIKKINFNRLIYLSLCLFAIFYYMLPAFKGNLISPYMRIEIPKSYFEMFKWFNSQSDNGRVANLPINSLWGWKYFNWYNNQKSSFQGADFLQFGIKQPLLDRDFDRWSPYNEQYFREMSKAIYDQNLIKLEAVLKKYDIKYILLDKAIFAPKEDLDLQSLLLKEAENLFSKSNYLQKVFQSGSLIIYRANFPFNQKVRIINNPLSVSPSTTALYEDFAYSKYSDYITYLDPRENAVFYPFRNIANNENKINAQISLPGDLLYKQYSATPTTNLANDCPTSISNSKSEMEVKDDIAGKFLRYSSLSGPLCNHYSFPDTPRDQGYLISITSRNITGLPLKLCVINYLSRRCDISTQLSPFSDFKEETFLLPPIGNGVGFDLNFNNFAITKSPSVNDLKLIKIISFPYSRLSQIEQYNSVNVFKETSVLSFSQSFEAGWKAYEINVKSQNSKVKSILTNIFPFFFGKELKNHVLVNNWENGWVLDSKFNVQDSKFVIIFWPQYLEYLGFLIFAGTFAVIFIAYFRTKKTIF